MAKKEAQLDIAYIKTEYHALEDLHEFQGNLKELWKDNAEKLWRQMVETGFSDPFKVWKDPDGRLNLLDGHQRRRVLIAKRKEKTTANRSCRGLGLMSQNTPFLISTELG